MPKGKPGRKTKAPRTSEVRRYSRQIYGVFHACGLTTKMAGNFINGLADLEETRGLKSVVSSMKEHWYAIVSGVGCRRHKDGTFYGHWRPISRLARKGRRGKARALRILKLYGYFRHPEPKRKDYWEKAMELSSAPEPTQPIVIPPKESFLRYYDSSWDKTKPFLYPLSAKKCPLDANGTMQAEVLTTPREHIQSLYMFPNFVAKFYDEISVLVGVDMPPKSSFEDLAPCIDVGGRVSLLTKDRGYKLRLVANTNRMLQLFLDPLKQYLANYMKAHPNCYVFDQDAGAEWVVKQFKLGKTLTCLDLKSATDNIPLEPQLQLILSCEPSLTPQVTMYRHVARMRWLTPYPDINITWKRGHPMGAGPSFGIFTLWLVHILEISGLGFEQFAVVGDDLVFQSSAEDAVLGILETYGIPLSEGKCLLSNRINAEFVGRVLDKHGEVRNLKASLPNRRRLMGIVRQYGVRALRFLVPRSMQTQYIRDIISINLAYESDECFREAVLAVATAKQRAKLLKLKPEPLNPGGLSWSILNKMVEPNTDPKVASYVRAKVFEPGQLYSLYKHCFVIVQALEVEYNPPSHREHRKMLLSDFDELDSEDDIAERLEMIRLNPGVTVVDVDKTEQDALSGVNRDDTEEEYKRFNDEDWSETRERYSLIEAIALTGTLLMLVLYLMN